MRLRLEVIFALFIVFATAQAVLAAPPIKCYSAVTASKKIEKANIRFTPLKDLDVTNYDQNRFEQPEVLNALPEDFPAKDRNDVVGFVDPTHPENYLNVYSKGEIPWRSVDDRRVTVHEPENRGILYVDELRVGETLTKFFKANVDRLNSQYVVTLDRAFNTVVDEARAMRRDGRPGQSATWLFEQMATAYKTMHPLGYTHTFEVWDRATGELVAGMIGTEVNGVFAGETMFHRKEFDADGNLVREVDNVGRLAGIAATLYLKMLGYKFIDTQVHKPKTFQGEAGGREITREQYRQEVIRAQQNPVEFMGTDDTFTVYFEPYTAAEVGNQRDLIGRPNKNKLTLIKVTEPYTPPPPPVAKKGQALPKAK